MHIYQLKGTCNVMLLFIVDLQLNVHAVCWYIQVCGLKAFGTSGG